LTAVASAGLQGVLGGLRLTMLKNEIGIFHACLAQAFLGLLVVIAVVTTNFWRSLAKVFADPRKFAPIKMIALATTIAIYVQLALGATMRHQHRDLAVLDFPTANGAWIPDTSANALAKINAWRDARALSDVTAFQIWLQMAHRFVALIIAAGIIASLFSIPAAASGLVALSGLSRVWAFLVLGRVTADALAVRLHNAHGHE